MLEVYSRVPHVNDFVYNRSCSNKTLTLSCQKGARDTMLGGTDGERETERERDSERELYEEPQSITEGLGRRPQYGLRITTRYPASPPKRWGNIL